MTTISAESARPGGWRRRLFAAGPYLLLAPGLLWLLYFFIWPAVQMFLMSISSGKRAKNSSPRAVAFTM